MISASQFAAAMGVGKRTRASLWKQIKWGEREKVNAYALGLMAYGKEHEHRAVEYAQNASGATFTHTGDWQRRLERGGYSGHPDGLNATQVLEVKCRNPALKAYIQVPPEHMPQVQGLIWLADRFEAVFGCWHPDPIRRRCWVVQRSEPYITRMLELLDEFCEALKRDKPPGRTARKKITKSLPKVETRLIDGPPILLPLDTGKCGVGLTAHQACYSALAQATNRTDCLIVDRYAKWSKMHPQDVRAVEDVITHVTPIMHEEPEIAF